MQAIPLAARAVRDNKQTQPPLDIKSKGGWVYFCGFLTPQLDVPPHRLHRESFPLTLAQCRHRAIQVCFFIEPFVGCDDHIAP